MQTTVFGSLLAIQVMIATSSAIHTYLNCSFDLDLCGMTQRSDDESDWIRFSKSTATPNTGPSSDHTSGKGYFMYFEASTPTKPGHRAILQSPVINSTNSDICVRFWYYLYGVHVGELTVNERRAGKRRTLYLLKGDQGQAWQQAEFKIKNANGLFSLDFQATRDQMHVGDMAIDDVTVEHRTQCQEAPTLPTTLAPTTTTVAPSTTRGPIYPFCTEKNLRAKSLLHEHPNDKSMYVRCDLEGREHLEQCPPGQVFFPETRTCAAAGCSSIFKPLIPKPPSPLQEETVLPRCHANPCSFSALHNASFYHKFGPDPSKFVACDTSGTAYLVQCPAGQTWVQKASGCLFHRQPASVAGLFVAPCTHTAVSNCWLRHPITAETNKYVECALTGRATQKACPQGQVYIPLKARCGAA